MNVSEKLAREIRRVTELRGHYEEAGRQPGVIVAPALLLMDAALEQACIAAGHHDALTQISAVQMLEGFEK